MVELERRGIPTAAVATEPFVDEALEQARVLGMHGYADRAFEEIVARLTQPHSPRADAAHPRR
jgi:hypothetical protein